MFQKFLEASYKTARRIVITVVGATVLLGGIALLVLPGPALVVIPAGLAILSLEFAFARRWLKAVRHHAERAVGRNNASESSAPPS